MRLVHLVCAFVCVCALLPAVETKTWEQDSMEDFDQGTLQHLSLSSDGRLTVAPAVREVYDSSTAVLWAVARDSKGNRLRRRRQPGRIAGQAVLDRRSQATGNCWRSWTESRCRRSRSTGRIACTRPHRRTAKFIAWTRTGKADVFYDPKTKYIWALAFAKNGDLYVATGDRGEIHRVTPAGVGSVFFRTEEAHARSMTMDCGGQPDRRHRAERPDHARLAALAKDLFCIKLPSARSRPWRSAPMARSTRRVRGIARPRRSPRPQPSVRRPTRPANPCPAGNGPNRGGVRRLPAALPMLSSQAVAGGSEIYRIQSDGYPRRIWSQAQDLVYALAFDAQGRLLAGTGNHGNLYRIDSDYSYTRLLNVEPTQITGLLRAPDGPLYAVTGNIGKVIAIGPELEPSGTFESDVLDAGGFSYWGRISKEPEAPAGTVFETRSGNVGRAQKNWSAWASSESRPRELPRPRAFCNIARR